MPHRSFAVLVTVAVSVLTLASATAAGPGSGDELTWRACGDGFECGTLAVPVDHRHPDGEQLDLAVRRRRATEPARRIGVLVVNYGGPGDPGAETLTSAYATLPSVVRARFDVVSFDPRGTGASRPIDCVDDATFERGWSDDLTPDDTAELRAFYDGTAGSVDLVEACVARHGSWLTHVGTRDVARDLDLLRNALGERTLTFLGYSYGTVLGAVYAQEFPTRIRAMVLDSVVDLSATRSEELRRQVVGFESTLDSFLAACDDLPQCRSALGDPRAALHELRDRFEEGLTLPAVGGRTVGVSEFYVGVIAALYARETWPALAQALVEAEQGDASVLTLLNDAIAGRRADGTYNNLQEAIGFILCADRYVTRVPFTEYQETFERLTARAPFLGPPLAASPVGCDPRIPQPAQRDTLGDVRAGPEARVLVIGVTGDPATPYAGARDLRRRIRGSRILTVDAEQHGGYARGIPCVDEHVNRYLVAEELPARGTVCRV